MDSGNTSGGSMQSSSSAEEEYNSRAQSSALSVFLTNQPPPTTNQLAQPFIPSLMFEPLSNYLDPITQRSNLDMMWPNSKSPRSEQNQTDLGALMPCSIPSSSNSPSQNQPFLSRGTTTTNNNNNCATFSTSTHQILPQESGSRGPMLSVSAANNDQTNINNNMVRNPKKRSRASRRAPTTVLTTDTTNFRAMVQEFTGIPAPPFTPSPFPRTRFDLFAMRPNSNNPPTTTPPYLLRPFPQKLHPFHNPHSFSTTVLPSNSNNSTNNNNNNNCSTNSTSSINYQQQLEALNILTFQNHPLANSSFLLSKTQPSLEIPPNLKMGVLEDLGFRHDHVNNTCLHQNMVSSTTVGAGALSNSVNNNNNNNLNNASSSTEWAQRTCTITSNDCDQGEGGVKCYSDDFHGEKGPEFTARSQGMVESWINCSSD